MPAKDGFQLTGDDIFLLHQVHQLRLATIDHLVALSGRSEKALRARLLKLRKQRYLTCPNRAITQKIVYVIGSEGQAALVHAGHAPREFAEKRLRSHELKELGIRHALFIADIHTKLILLTRNSPISIMGWVEGPSLSDSVNTFDANGHEIVMPVWPDIWFTLKHTEILEGKNKFHFFAEADRGTMSHERMRDKVKGYTAYFQQQRHTKKYGIKLFKVATITKTKGRAAELANTYRGMLEPAWLRAYPVIPFEDLTLDLLVPMATPAGV